MTKSDNNSFGLLITIIVVIMYFSIPSFRNYVNNSFTNLFKKDAPLSTFDNNRKMNDIKNAMDLTNPITRTYALDIAKQYPGEFNLNQVCAIWQHCKNQWKYVNDPRGVEYVAKASETINNGLAGDCDDFAVLIATLIEGIGGQTRISYAHNAESGHAFTEVFVGDYNNMINISNNIRAIYGINDDIKYRKDNQNKWWLNLDWFANHVGGKYFPYTDCIIFYPRENIVETK